MKDILHIPGMRGAKADEVYDNEIYFNCRKSVWGKDLAELCRKVNTKIENFVITLESSGAYILLFTHSAAGGAYIELDLNTLASRNMEVPFEIKLNGDALYPPDYNSVAAQIADYIRKIGKELHGMHLV